MNKAESKYFKTAKIMDEALLELIQVKNFDYLTVKEICHKAGVNRSTFYLHYETSRDLLEEAINNLSADFNEKFKVSAEIENKDFAKVDLKDLVFMTRDYLVADLESIKNNKAAFTAGVEKTELMNSVCCFHKMENSILDPILTRFNIKEEERSYILAFYIHGLIAMTMEWVKKDCSDSVDSLVKLIQNCVLPGGLDS